MNKNIIRSIVISGIIVAIGSTVTGMGRVIARDDGDTLDQGTYDVPGRPDMKLRVFVYKGKVDQQARQNNGKPAPQPTLTCRTTSVADPDSNAVVDPVGWLLPSSFQYHLNVASVPSTVGGNSLPTIAANSYDSWQSAINNKVTITRGADTTVAKAQLDNINIVTWGRTSGSALAVTYTWYNRSTGEVVESDVIMNKSFTWYWSDPSTWGGQTCAYTGVYDAQNIMTHEFGHTFGLDDMLSSTNANNTMYGYGATGETKKDTLTTGDMNAVSVLY